MPGVKIGTTEDGRPRYTYSQSWLNTFMACPEAARREMAGLVPHTSTDATEIGSATHAGIEVTLDGGTYSDGLEAANNYFQDAIDQGDMQWKQIKNASTAFKWVEHCYTAWYELVFPRIPGVVAIEEPFDIVLSDDSRRVLRLKGAIDLVDSDLMVWDWKTANQVYEQWEVDRYKLQPTAYTLAVSRLYASETASWDEFGFTYAVMPKSTSRQPQVLPTKRGPAQWDWMTHQCARIADLIEAELDEWPMIDQGWKCSAKWCDSWSSCKGSFVDPQGVFINAGA